MSSKLSAPASRKIGKTQKNDTTRGLSPKTRKHVFNDLAIFRVLQKNLEKVFLSGIGSIERIFKALLHCAIFPATCLAMLENIALQIAEVGS